MTANVAKVIDIGPVGGDRRALQKRLDPGLREAVETPSPLTYGATSGTLVRLMGRLWRATEELTTRAADSLGIQKVVQFTRLAERLRAHAQRTDGAHLGVIERELTSYEALLPPGGASVEILELVALARTELERLRSVVLASGGVTESPAPVAAADDGPITQAPDTKAPRAVGGAQRASASARAPVQRPRDGLQLPYLLVGGAAAVACVAAVYLTVAGNRGSTVVVPVASAAAPVAAAPVAASPGRNRPALTDSNN